MLLQMSAERFNQLRGIGEQEYTINSLTEEQREKERLVKEKIREIPQEKRTEKLEQKAQELIESANVRFDVYSGRQPSASLFGRKQDDRVS